jgi:hypothetical protein
MQITQIYWTISSVEMKQHNKEYENDHENRHSSSKHPIKTHINLK